MCGIENGSDGNILYVGILSLRIRILSSLIIQARRGNLQILIYHRIFKVVIYIYIYMIKFQQWPLTERIYNFQTDRKRKVK